MQQLSTCLKLGRAERSSQTSWRWQQLALKRHASEINAALRGHYAYYGVAGNIRALFKVYRAVERYWHKMLRSRSRAASRLTWGTFNQIKQRTPLLRPKLRLPRSAVNQLPKSVVRETRTPRSVGTGGGRVAASRDPVKRPTMGLDYPSDLGRR